MELIKPAQPCFVMQASLTKFGSLADSMKMNTHNKG